MSKHLYCIKGVLKPRKFSARLIRNKLSSFGLRGGALRSDTARILAGPVDGIKGTYPFGWSDQHFDRRMKRIFIRASNASRLSDNRPIALRRRSALTISKKYLSV
ncbi:TPA: hypothetical protein QCK30_004472 [Enterobacter sichuanensis]|nr:hypothetical protein [Salmonella enterica subsp. enterica serovar Goldcoast]MEB0963221.1 hypothetical protein [Citrobacter freundii]HDR2845941.1 hypothetical protein [Enterobacter sichuanensis]